MKVLEILKRVSNECEADENFMGYTYEAKKVDKLINEAIKELELLSNSLQLKTCDGCRYLDEKNKLEPFGLLPDYCKSCARVASDKWEGKND